VRGGNYGLVWNEFGEQLRGAQVHVLLGEWVHCGVDGGGGGGYV